MAFNTGNPVEPNGSTDPRDLKDNAPIIDKLVNSSDFTWFGRLGKALKTWAGMEQDFNSAQDNRELEFYLLLSRTGFESLHLTYVSGIPLTVDRPTQLIDYNGSMYRVKLPATFPLMLTGTWATDAPKLVDVADASLRSQVVFKANTYTELQSLSTATMANAAVYGRTAIGDGGHGLFRFLAGDQSAKVTSDPLQGLFVPPTTDLTGASGVWARMWDKSAPRPEWWGQSANPVSVNSNTLPVSLLKNRAGANQDQWVLLFGDSHGWGQGSPESQVYTTAGNVSVHSANLHNKGFMQRLCDDIDQRRGFETCAYGAWTVNYPATGIRQGFYDIDSQERASNDPIRIRPIVPVAGKILGALVPLAATGSLTNTRWYSPAATGRSYVQVWREKLARGVFGQPMLTMALETVDDFREAGKTEFFQLQVNPARVASGAGYTTYSSPTGGIYAEISTGGDVYVSTVHTIANLPDWIAVGKLVVLPGYGLVQVMQLSTTNGGLTIRIATAAGVALGATGIKAVREGLRFYHPMYLQRSLARIAMKAPARVFYVAVRHKPGAGTLSFYFADNLGTAGSGNTPYATPTVAQVNANDFEWFSGGAAGPTVALPSGQFAPAAKASVTASNYAIDCSPITAGVTEEVIYRMDFGTTQVGDLFIESTGTCDFRGLIFDNNKTVNLSMGGHTVGGWIGTEASFSDAATDHVGQILNHVPVQPSHVISQVPFVNEYLRQTPVATFKANLLTFINRFKNHLPGSNNFNAKGVDFLFFTSLRQRSVGWEGAASAPITFDMYVQAAREFCAANGCAFIDVEAALSTEIRSGKIDYQRLYNDDSHPSDYANDLIYQELKKTIQAVV